MKGEGNKSPEQQCWVFIPASPNLGVSLGFRCCWEGTDGFFFKVSWLKSILQAVISAELLLGHPMELHQYNQQLCLPGCVGC